LPTAKTWTTMPSLIARSKFTSRTFSSKQSAKGHYNKQGLAVLDSRKQQVQWIKSTTSLTRETKRKKVGRRLKNAFSSYGLAPQLQKTKATIIPGEGQRTCSREPAGCPLEFSPPLSPGACSTRRPSAVGSMRGHGMGRLRSGRKVRRSESATFCLQHHAPGRASAEEYQGSHKGDMVAYHAPRKGD